MPLPKDIVATANDIRSYLRLHKNAADSAEHIARWWLSRQRYEQARELVDAALAYLVERGDIAKSTGPDGTAVYSRKSNADDHEA